MEKVALSSGIKVILEIPQFIEKKTPSSVIFYQINITTDTAKWSIEKRFSEFDALYKEIAKKFTSLPSLPSKTIMKLTSHEGLIKRQQDLSLFLKNLISRPSLLNHQAMRSFLELDLHHQFAVPPSPKKIAELTDLPLGVRDFLFIENDSILFVALSDMKITSRIDAYLTNVTLPWEKQTGTHVTVGALLAYKVGKDAETGNWKFERLWVKSYPVQTNMLCWEPSLKLLAIGMDDGKIYCLRIAAEYKYMQYEEYCTLKAHTARVMGIAIEGSKNLLYSVGEDKKFKTTDLSYQEAIADITVGTSMLKYLQFDPENRRAFIIDGAGELYIYSVAEKPPKLVRQVNAGTKACLRGLELDLVRNYVFTCATDGLLTIFETGKPGKDRFTKIIGSMKVSRLLLFAK